MSDLLALLGRKLDLLNDRLASASPRWLTIQAAADYSGLSVESVRRLLSSRRLTAHRPVKGRILLDRSELDALIQASATQARAAGKVTRGGFQAEANR
jgi:excisionase family DNA binding protein